MGRGSNSYTAIRRRAVQGTGGRKGKLKPMDVSQFDGMTLQEIEDRERSLKHEEMFAIDKDGKVIAAYKGNKNSVAFPASLLSEKGITVTHGHPIGAEGYGGTLSIQDVLNMAASDWAEHRAAAQGKGEMNYIIRRNAKTTEQNSRDLYARIQKDTPALKQQMLDAANKAGGKLSPARRRQIYTGVLDRYYAEVLPQYNFEYIARNKPYRYNR